MKRPSAGSVVRALVAIVLTAVILWKSDPGQVWSATMGADLSLIGAAVALVLVDRALMAWRWLLLLRSLSDASRLSLGAVMRIFFISTFVGTFLPASVGGDAVRALSLARHEVSTAAAVASVFMDRVLGVLSVLLVGVAGLLFAPDLATDPVVLAALAAATVGCVVAALLVFSPRIAGIVPAMLAGVGLGRLSRAGSALVDAVQRYASSHRVLINVLAGSVAVQILRVLQAYLLGRALGLGVPLTAYLAFIPLILLVMLLPVTVNGIGTSQAAFVWLFGRASVAAAPAFTLSVLFVALGVVGNLPGAWLYATRGLGAPIREEANR